MSDQAIVKVQHVSKKFCRSLKRSLWYGVKDLASEIAAHPHDKDIQLRPAEFLAVDDVSFELKRGECLGLIGPNGAGKSTLLKILNGVIRPDAGRIAITGRVGALIELGTGFSPILSGRENIYINGAVLGFSKSEIDAKLDGIVDFAELDDAIDAPVQTYSSGMYVRLGFAVAAQLNPDILLVDEILAVGDMAFRIKCMNRIWSLLKSGAAVILVSHNMYHVQAFATRAILLKKGRICSEGEPSLVANEYEESVARQAVKLGEPETTGPVRFRDVRLSSMGQNLADGDGWPVAETNGPLRISVRYEIAEQLSEGIQVTMLFKNSEGHRVASFASSGDGVSLPDSPGVYWVHFDFDSNLLLNGQYYCDLSSFNIAYTHNLGHWMAAFKFRVRTPGFNGLQYVGNVFLPHRISVSDDRG